MSSPRAARAQEVGGTEGLLPEPDLLRRGIQFANRAQGRGEDDSTKNGFFAELSHMPTGSGWISAGPGYRYWFGEQAVVESSAAISWRNYKMARVSFEMPKLARSRIVAGTELDWNDMTQVNYFGNGPDSLDADRSDYRMKTLDMVGYGAYQPIQHLAIGGRFGRLAAPSLAEPSGFFKRGNPDAAVTFATDPVFLRGDQPDYLYGGASITFDNRNARSYPTRGGVYRAQWTSFLDRSDGDFSHRLYEAEAAQLIPVFDQRLVFAAHGWVAATETDGGSTVPLYLAPSLGGHNSLRGYSNYRFHDRNMAVVTAEARLALMTHVDVAVFADAGNVASRFGDLNLDRRDYGVGLRVHSARTTFGRFDIAHGSEGWQLMFRTSDPLHLRRLRTHTVAAPFVQ
jgi:hypothetical protein